MTKSDFDLSTRMSQSANAFFAHLHRLAPPLPVAHQSSEQSSETDKSCTNVFDLFRAVAIPRARMFHALREQQCAQAGLTASFTSDTLRAFFESTRHTIDIERRIAAIVGAPVAMLSGLLGSIQQARLGSLLITAEPPMIPSTSSSAATVGNAQRLCASVEAVVLGHIGRFVNALCLRIDTLTKDLCDRSTGAADDGDDADSFADIDADFEFDQLPNDAELQAARGQITTMCDAAGSASTPALVAAVADACAKPFGAMVTRVLTAFGRRWLEAHAQISQSTEHDLHSQNHNQMHAVTLKQKQRHCVRAMMAALAGVRRLQARVLQLVFPTVDLIGEPLVSSPSSPSFAQQTNTNVVAVFQRAIDDAWQTAWISLPASDDCARDVLSSSSRPTVTRRTASAMLAAFFDSNLSADDDDAETTTSLASSQYASQTSVDWQIFVDDNGAESSSSHIDWTAVGHSLSFFAASAVTADSSSSSASTSKTRYMGSASLALSLSTPAAAAIACLILVGQTHGRTPALPATAQLSVTDRPIAVGDRGVSTVYLCFLSF
jgi:hypothetical protein